MGGATVMGYLDQDGQQQKVYLGDDGNPVTALPTPAQSLQGAVDYGVQQDPVAHAKLLQLQQKLGIPPVVSQGNEKPLQQAADTKSIDYPSFAAANPRTTSWATNPDNAAVSGVDELHRLAGIEQNAAAMRSVPQNTDQPVSNWGILKDQFFEALKHPMETLLGADTPSVEAAKMSAVKQMADQTGDPFFRGVVATQEFAQKPLIAVSGTQAFQKALNPKSNNIFSRAVTGSTKAIEGLTSPSNIELLAALPFAPEDASSIVSGVFGSQMAGSAASGAAQAVQSAGQGRYGDAAEQGVGALTSGAFAFASAKHAIGESVASAVAEPQPVPVPAVPEAYAQQFNSSPYLRNVAEAVNSTEASALRERSPDKFYEATQAHFEGDQSIRIPAQQFADYFRSKQFDPSAVADHIGATNYAEAVMSGGDVEVHPADFLSGLDPEHQKALLPDVVDPATGLSARQHQEGREDLEKWVTDGGADKLLNETQATDAETASSPEFQAVKEELRQRYVDAGETPEVADTLSEKDANVYSNIARSASLKPSELLAMYNPKVVSSVSDIEPGMTRLYHGGNAELNDTEPKWYASDKDYAQGYADKSGGKVSYIDYPTDKVNAAIDPDGHGQTLKQGFTFRGELPFSETGPRKAVADFLNQDSPEGGRRGWFKANPDGSFEIGKTKIGDLSTFVHEPAHAYLKIIGDLATRDGASDVLKSDHAKILDYLGAKPGEELTTEQQEKWARANEQYLREGKAPSSALRGAFQRFGVWLQSVYKKASDLGVELNGDIKGVLDRLYASEAGVDRAAKEAGQRMFSSADEAGWTEEQFKSYAEAHDVSVEQAKSHILGKLNEAAVRDKADEWREEESNVREAMTSEIDQRREYAAIRQLRKGKMEDGTALTMSKEALVKQFGEERVKELQKAHPGLYRTEGGLEPDTAAEILGFNSADEMVGALQGTQRRAAAIEQATREYMTAKHGDIRYDGTLQDQARLAVENDKRAAGLHTELAALRRQVEKLKEGDQNRKIAARSVAVAPIEAYREMARQAMESKAPADLQPNRYLDASRKYSRESFDAMRKGDPWEAAQAKHKELLNHFLFREAVKAKEYVGKFESYVKRMQSDGVQKKLGLAGQDYRDQLNGIMARYQLSDYKGQPEQRLSDWVNDQFAREKEPVIDPQILNEARTVNYRNAPISELRLVHDALVNVRKLASLELKNEVNGRKIVFAEAMAKMIAAVRENVKVRPEQVFEEDQGKLDYAHDLVSRGVAPMIRMEFLMRRLDGGDSGPWHDNLFHLAADVQGREHALQEEVTAKLGESMERLPKEQQLKLLDKVKVEGITLPVTRKRMISMAMNMGNEGNLDRLQKTFQANGWDVGAIDKVKTALTREEWQHVQDTWDTLKPLGKAQSELEQRQTGLPPVMVQPTPLSIDLADGSTMKLDGGYFPIHMDSKRSEAGARQIEGTVQNAVESGYTRATTSRGNMKERTGYGGPLLLDYEQVLTQHTAKVIKDITHREFVQTANKFLNDPGLMQSLRETVGPGYEQQMMPWVRRLVNDRNGSIVQGLGDFSGWLGKLRTNIVQASLGFKASTLLLQLTHASSIFLHTSPSSYAQSMIDFMAHPSEVTDQIRDLSPNEMANRGEYIDRDAAKMYQTKIKGSSFGESIGKAGMFPVKMMDHLLSFPLWMSVYRDALAEHAKTGADETDEARYQAMQKADGAVRTGLGSNAPKDLPAIMSKNDFWKTITTLGGFHNLKLNQMISVGYDYGRNKSVGNLTYGMMMAAIVPAVLGSYISGQRPKDDESTGAWAAKKALLFAPETVPVLGQVVQGVENKGDVRFTPLFDLGKNAAKTAYRAGEDKEDKDWTGIGIGAGEVAGTTFGVAGTTQMSKTARYYRDAQSGRIDDPNFWDAIVGRPPKK